MSDYENPPEEIDGDERPRDPVLDQAIERLRSFFTDASSRLFYSTQIETTLEREFFHWIVGRGLLELGNAGELTRRTVPLQGQSINFYANRKHRYFERELKTMLDLLARIYDPEFMFEIFKSGGFGLLFEDQMYPWGHAALLKEVREKFGLKVSAPKDVKDGDMQRLVKWHNAKLPRSPGQWYSG